MRTQSASTAALSAASDLASMTRSATRGSATLYQAPPRGHNRHRKRLPLRGFGGQAAAPAARAAAARAGAPAAFWPRLALTAAYSAALLTIRPGHMVAPGRDAQIPSTITPARRNYPARARD